MEHTEHVKKTHEPPHSAVTDDQQDERLRMDKAKTSTTAPTAMGSGSTIAQQKLREYLLTHKAKKPPKTIGEIMFNTADWGGIGLGLNSGFSIWAADQTKHAWGWRPFQKASMAVSNLFRHTKAEEADYIRAMQIKDFLAKNTHSELAARIQGEKKLASVFLKEIGTPEHSVLDALHAEGLLKEAGNLEKEFEKFSKFGQRFINCSDLMEFGMLTTGGFVMMAPIKLFEDKKPQIVRWIDDHFKGKNQSEMTRDRIEARHGYIDNEARQTWRSVMGSRLISLVPIMTTYHLTSKPKNIISDWTPIPYKGTGYYTETAANYVAEKLENSSTTKELAGRMEASLAETPKKVMEELERTQDPRQPLFNTVDGQQRLRNIFNLTGLEAIYSSIMVGMTFAGSRILAPFFEKEHNEKLRDEIRKELKSGKAPETLVQEDTELPESLTPSNMPKEVVQPTEDSPTSTVSEMRLEEKEEHKKEHDKERNTETDDSEHKTDHKKHARHTERVSDDKDASESRHHNI